MANPNIVNVTSIYGENSLTALSSTSATQLISNAVGSGKVYKINAIVVANVDGAAATSVTISIYDQAGIVGTAFPIVSTASVPADGSLIVTDKSTSFYLKENQSVGATAGTANDLVVTASWDEIN